MNKVEELRKDTCKKSFQDRITLELRSMEGIQKADVDEELYHFKDVAARL